MPRFWHVHSINVGVYTIKHTRLSQCFYHDALVSRSKKTTTSGALDRVVLSSTAVHTLCTLVEFCTAAHAFLDGLFICVHFTSGIRLACFPPWLLCATAVAPAAGSQLSMLLEVRSNVSMLQLQVSSASYCSRQAGRQAKKAPLVCNS